MRQKPASGFDRHIHVRSQLDVLIPILQRIKQLRCRLHYEDVWWLYRSGSSDI